MKKASILLVAIFLIALNFSAQAQISGTVFRDFNGTGIKENTATYNEPFVAGVTVKAFNAANIQVGATKTTSAAGAYNFTAVEIPSTTKVRIEFSNLAVGDASSINGTGNGTSVQFVTAPNAATNFAINAPDDYWDTINLPNPKLLSIIYRHGDINHSNATSIESGILQIDNNTTGRLPARPNVATQQQVGSVWGMGYQKTHNRYFFSNFLKRHVGFGPQGVGGVYMANLSGANYALSGSFTLQGVTPSNSTTALDMGTVNRVSTPNTSDFYLATGTDANGKDMDAFGKVGKVGFGDVEMDDKNQQLIMVNLNQRRLVTINVAGNTTSLNNATVATLSPLTKAYDILSLPGVPSCVSGQLRPWALKIYKGRGYLGLVCDASATPRDSTNLSGYILSFDPANIAAGFTTEITLNLNYRTSSTNANTNRWHSWADVWADVNVASTGLYRYPEPLITDLEFDENGGLNISITDRFGHQMGISQTIPVAGSTTVPGEARISGDILHACRVGASWVMEGAAGSCTPVNADDNTDGYGDGQTIGVAEYYNDESGDAFTGEFTQGGMAKLMGSNRLVQTIVDPTPTPNTTGEPYYYSAGMHWYDINTGGWTNWTAVYDNTGTGALSGGFLKGNAMGDIEFALSPQPIQIGNRIWNDLNGNGIQDANETTSPVAAGTIVTLRSPGIDDIYGNADDQTWTTTTDVNGNYYFSALATADNRKPVAWTGVGSTILSGYDYRIEFGIPAGFQLTKTDVAINTADNIDNDAVLNGTNAFVTFNTGNTNHNFDIGIKPLGSIGDKVWLDNGAGGGTTNNGTQDGTEPGVAGVTVSLLDNAGVVIATTVTDAFGNYLFDNLAAGTYSIRVTAPVNHTFTTQTNTTDDNNTTGTSTTGSDVSVTTGQSYPVVLSLGENNRNIDAGLIFTTPVATNSIGDRIWFDNGIGGGTAGNGVQDGTEPGVAGVTVTLYAADGVTVIATTVTDANGNYIFTNLPASTNYIIGVTPPAGTVFAPTTGTTTANGNSDVNATLGSATYGKTTVVSTGVAGTQVTGIDAGIVTQAAGTASLGDKVWNDLNNNGTQDAGEPGIAGVTVNLYEDVNGDGVLAGGELTAVRTVVTDAFGNYIFNGLVVTATNKWQLEFVQPAGYTNTAVANSNTGADETDSDITNNATDRTDFIRLKADDRNTSVDAGFVLTAPAGTLKLGDKVWRDDNANGQQDATETGVAGVTVKLYQNGVDGLAGTADDVLIATKTTDINGNYLFTNLAASTTLATNYNVQYSNIPANFIFTTQTTGATATDNNANNIGKTGSINLTADDLTIDAGIKQGAPVGTASLGNRVWYDVNNNGLQDATELGVGNVRVELLTSAGAVVNVPSTATPYVIYTNALGEYLFTGLPAGDYTVRFSRLPAGYTSSTANTGTNDLIDADANFAGISVTATTTATTAVYTLQTGEDNLTVDMGIVPATGTNSVGNFVWNDTNADGLQTVGEPGVAGVTVSLYTNGADGLPGTADDVLVAVTTTDNAGAYSFVGLADGNYNIGIGNLPAGAKLTTQTTGTATGSDVDAASGRTGTIALDPTSVSAIGINNADIDAGITSTTAALGNKIFDDLNGDGIQNAGEPGVSGVQVILYAADGVTVLSSTITDANGNYLFANLTAGTYVVGVNAATIPLGMQFTAQDNTTGPDGDGVNTTTGGGDSDVSPVTGKTAAIVLTAGQVNLTVDAGVRRTPVATVGNRVWDDANGNGLQDAGEAGIPGVIATLYNNAGVAVGSAVTDANGNWLINNVAVGTGYYVIFTNKPKGNFTIQDNGGVGTGGATDSDTDSDVNASGQTGIFDVTVNTINVKIDAGIIKGLASLGNRVWLDNGVGGGTANDGVQNGTEPGVAGVAVSLYQNGADGLPGTNDDVLVGATITDAYGNYLFENLTASSGATTQYNVRVTPPANYTFTTQTNTTDDNNTSGASTTGSDVNVLGVSYSIDLGAGENNPNIDAGLIFTTPVATNSIGDKVWFDANGDGINANNATEPGVAGVTVTLYEAATGNVVAITTTDANGNYIFNNLPANTNYQVGFSALGGTVLTTGGVLDLNNTSTNSDPSPTTGLTSTINTSSAGTQITGVDAGLKNDVKGALGDFVWNDINNNGIQDAGEPGIPGATMQLYNTGADGLPGGAGANADVLLATVTTDANGYYVFPNLDPAKYFVVATPVVGYSLSAKDVANPAGNTKDNDFGTGTGAYSTKYVSSVFTLQSIVGGVTRDMTVDLGIHNNAPINTLNTLGDKVWNDVNKDGLQTAGEAGVPNVTVRLLTSAGVAVNNPATGKPYVVMSDANGNYKFVDLVDGNYIVEFSNIPAGYSFTGLDASGSGAPGSGTDGTNDSDAKTTTGRTAIISVDATSASATSVNIVTVDAGISQGIAAGTASLGNRVWYDVNNNGLQDATELGVGNVRVELLTSAGAVVNIPSTATPYVIYTNALGEYLFTGLPAGDYTVRFSRLYI
jgi:hypothetical protein